LRGWIEYYGRYHASSLYSVFEYFNKTLGKWVRRKYHKLRHNKNGAKAFMEREPYLFAHWKKGIVIVHGKKSFFVSGGRLNEGMDN